MGESEVGNSSGETLVPESRGELLLRRTSEILNANPSEIEFRNLTEYVAGNNRFLYGFTRDCFIKIGGEFKETKEPPNEQLMRESLAMQIAFKAGFPVIEVRVPCVEIGIESPEVFLAVQKLSFNEGLLFTSNEQVAIAQPDLGAKVAKGLIVSERQIPTDQETSILKRGDWRSNSPDTFRKVWQEEVKGVLFEEYGQERNEIIEKEKLEEIIKKGEETIEELLGETTFSEDEFLVHNDLSPGNVFMSNAGEVFFLDWEHAGATHFENLALLTDMTNFWARSWPNPEIQSEFIKTFFKEAVENQKDSKLTYSLLKTMIIHGSLYLAKYAMAKDHHEHKMSVSLLSNLETNLVVLEETRKEMLGEKE